jgi:hypothetical protein
MAKRVIYPLWSSSAVQPMGRREGSGNFARRRLSASNFSMATSCLVSVRPCFSRTKARTARTLMSTARDTRSTLAIIKQPCPVNATGGLSSRRLDLDVVTICDPHGFPLRSLETKHEVRWKAAEIPFHLLIQLLCRHSVDGGEVGVENDLCVSKTADLSWNRTNLCSSHGQPPVSWLPASILVCPGATPVHAAFAELRTKVHNARP